MKNSYKFFENTDCLYYPCHNTAENMNCLFCYCPLYHLTECPGNYELVETNGKVVKQCTDCTFPHEAENYEIIMSFLSN